MKHVLLLLTLFISGTAAYAQTSHEISGAVRDSSGLSVISATVKLSSATDTMQTRTDAEGAFTFRNVKSAQFVLSVSSLGFSDFVRRYRYTASTAQIKVDPIVLRSKSNVLKEVIISGAAPVVVKQDTVEYRASDFPVRENSVAEDVIKRLPGVEVDKDGNVTTQGKSVTRIKVNGKDYFDGDLKTATQGLPADIIDKIQIVDDYGDQANITGIREGEADKIINITIARDKMKGFVVSGIAGGGNEGRYQASGTGQFMDNDRQLDVRMNLNNINASTFNFDGGGSRSFGGGGRGNRGGGDGGNSGGGYSRFGNSGGISNSSSGGLNYRDELSKKLSINGSYRFFMRTNNTISNSLRTSYFGTDSLLTSSRGDNQSIFNVHGGSFNMEYAIDSLNYLRISPYFYLSQNETNGLTNQFIQQTNRPREDQLTDLLSNANTPTLGGNIIYNHRFRKLGRNLSFGLNLNNSDSDNEQDVNDFFQYYNPDLTLRADSLSHRFIETSNKRFNANANVTYSEPVGKFGRMDLGYNYAVADYANSRITNFYQGEVPVIDEDLSNVFDYTFTTNRFSLNYRYDRPKLYNFTVGVTAQPTLLEGYSRTNGIRSSRDGFNFFPTARFDYNFGRTRSLSINYNARSQEPSFTQIQPVVDLSNPLRPIVGNPDLNSAFTQSATVRYNLSVPTTGLFLNAGLFGNITNDQITRNIVRTQEDILVEGKTTKRTIQTTSYLNADDYYSVNAFYSFGKSFLNKKYRLSLNGSLGYINDVAFTNNTKNIGKNWTMAQSVRLQINPNRNIEIYPAVGYRSTNVNYSLEGARDTRAYTLNYDLNGKIYFLKTFIVGFDVSKNVNQGYSSINANPLIVTTYLEKQFSKRRGAFRLQGYDLLNEGTVVAISQDANTITNSQTNRLTRYVMATLSFRLQKFPGGMQPNMDRGRDGGNNPRQGGRGNFGGGDH